MQTLTLMIVVGAVALLMAALGTRWYRQSINPLTLFSVLDIGLLTLLSAIVTAQAYEGEDTGLGQVLALTLVYCAGVVAVFVPRRFGLPRRLFAALGRLASASPQSARHSAGNQLAGILLTIAAFLTLMAASGAGLLWITDPRTAYQSYRAGVGLLYLLVQWTLLASFVYYAWTRRPTWRRLVLGAVLYSVAAYFTGSKANILAGLVFATIYFHFRIRSLPIVALLIGPPVVVFGFLLILLLQGSFVDLISAVAYFRDYAEVTGQFLLRFDEFGFHYGNALLSDLWFYVPRALFPSKPYEYGIALIHRVLFPGAAEEGATPGILPWAMAYLDFGVLGVFLSGLVTGFIRRGAYEAYLARPESLFAFLLMIQISLLPIFAYATLPMMLVIAALLALQARTRIVLFSKRFRAARAAAASAAGRP